MALAKRARVDSDDEDGEDPSMMTMTVASSGEGQRKNALVRSVKRTSGLEAPIVSLAGAHGVSLFPYMRLGPRDMSCSSILVSWSKQ